MDGITFLFCRITGNHKLCRNINIVFDIGRYAVLYSVFNLSLFRIIESVKRTYKVTCDTAYAVKGYLAEMICEIGKISVNVYIKLGDQFSGVSFDSILNVSVNLFLIECAVFTFTFTITIFLSIYCI